MINILFIKSQLCHIDLNYMFNLSKFSLINNIYNY